MKKKEIYIYQKSDFKSTCCKDCEFALVENEAILYVLVSKNHWDFLTCSEILKPASNIELLKSFLVHSESLCLLFYLFTSIISPSFCFYSRAVYFKIYPICPRLPDSFSPRSTSYYFCKYIQDSFEIPGSFWNCSPTEGCVPDT